MVYTYSFIAFYKRVCRDFFINFVLLIPKQRGVLSFPETIQIQVIKCIENADCERGCSQQWYRERGRLNS